MRIAVIAHFDFGREWGENFISLLRSVAEVVDQVIVVTTADMPRLPVDFIRTTLIRRPNIGYDFYSYRVGIEAAFSEYECIEGILILNSSLCLLDESKFRKTLLEIFRNDKSLSAFGLTASQQIYSHIQSYLIYFDLEYLPKFWLRNFFNLVEPLNTKFEVVVRYEIGLTKALRSGGFSIGALFSPSSMDKALGSFAVIKSIFRREGWGAWCRKANWLAYRGINWTHFGAVMLAQKYGVAKSEFLRSNPHCLDQSKVWEMCSKKLRQSVENLIGETRDLYEQKKSGLTEFSKTKCELGIIKQIVVSLRHRVSNAKVAVVIHLFYKDLLLEILNELDNILEPFDLFISTPFEADLPLIIDATDSIGLNVTLLLVNNQGRDVGPFIALYRTGQLDKYDAVLKLHSKRSKYSEKGDLWRRELITSLCGDSLTILKTLGLLREGKCGIIGPARFFLTNPGYWGANRLQLIKILNDCGLEIDCNSAELAFFAGTMFWFSPSVLRLIHDCSSASVTFELENGKQDGTLAHAWERAFCIIARSCGFRVSATEINGVDLFNVDNSFNRVPVLNNNPTD